MAISTKTGDDGSTGLMFNRRVPKDHPRVEAYGTVDELVSALGIVRALSTEDALAEEIKRIQEELMVLMSDLAVLPVDLERYRAKGRPGLSAEALDQLEAWVGRMESASGGFRGWVVPGDSLIGAHLHLARTICRRAERRVARLHREEPLDRRLSTYLNRLSDALWLAARSAK
ncbi:MAG: cob(I)yrinic acid a,c-diamide adenosyltransferase [Opitutales bacterium]|nr:cob(I)yrinic acid a,c-diamide adenosyltransferase [Opitutales bacterium]